MEERLVSLDYISPRKIFNNDELQYVLNMNLDDEKIYQK